MVQYRIQGRFGKRRLVDGENRALVRIEDGRIFGWTRKIVEIPSGMVYETDLIDVAGGGIHTHKYVMRRGRDVVAEAYLETADLLQKGAALPQRAAGMGIHTPYGLWTVGRSPGDSAVIECRGQRIADIPAHCRGNERLLHVYTRLDLGFVAGIYSLISYMAEEEHIVLV